MLQITKMRVNYEAQPIGITGIPDFSWSLVSGMPDTVQTDYRLELAQDEAFTQMVYEKQEKTSRSQHHRYPDISLRPMCRYYWRVRVWDNHGQDSGYSAPGSFVTALMETREWKGEFISAEQPEDREDSKGTCLRRCFPIEGEVAHAYVCCTALGLYQLYLNGERVGEDELTPGWTSYQKHLCYQMYDVTEHLQDVREGCLGVMLGAGYYKGKMGFLHLRNNYGEQTAFLGQLHIRYRDGREQVIGTDQSWKGTDAPVLFSEIYDGEIYDAGQEIAGWNRPGSCGGTWREVTVIPYDKSALISQCGSKVGVMERLPAQKLFYTPRGELVVDFGQNMAGWVQVTLHHTKPGEQLKLRCFETLDKDGNVYTDNLREAKAAFTYFCKGSETEVCQPHFTYMGFRYAQLLCVPGELEKEDMTALVLYSRMEQTGAFRCSSPLLNQLWSNITWSMKGNFVDIPTDCPQRDERMGWTGDAQIFCRTASYIMNTYVFFEKWLADVKADQTPEGGVPHMVPDIITPNIGKQEDWLLSQGTHSAAAWADVAVLNPWNLYLTFGDKQILEEQYESMRSWIRFMESHAEGIIWNYRLQFGDWVALDAEEGSYYGATPNDLTCTAYYAYSTGIFSKIAELLGHQEDAEYFGGLAKRIREGFAEQFFDPETGGMTVQTQTAHIIALYFDLTPEPYREQTVKELLELLEKENGHLVTGFVGTPYFTHALSRNGHLKEAYELLEKEDFPSWLYQVKRGATTIWEHWDGLKPDGSMWSPDMNSFNHYAYGAIGEWLIRVVGGLEAEEQEPGYHRIRFCPRPGGSLDWAEAEYESGYGRISSRWEREGACIRYRFEVPANTSARICLEEVERVLEAGPGIREITGGAEGVWEAEAGSGIHEITVSAKDVSLTT